MDYSLQCDFNRLKTNAEEGNPNAQYELARLIEISNGVHADLRAAEWYRRSAEGGHVPSQIRMAQLYLEGRGVSESRKTAIEWLQRALQNGNNEAKEILLSLGIYESESEEIFYSVLNQAKSGDAVAQYDMGLMYYNGMEVLQNKRIAYEWFLKSAKQNHSDGILAVGCMNLYGEDLQINKQEAIKWFRLSVEGDNEMGMYILGDCYAKGDGVERNYEQAAALFLRSAKKGNRGAQCELGILYGAGLGIDKNEEQAISWCLKSALQGLPIAQHIMGMAYEAGDGVQRDVHKALKWYRRASKQGFEDSRKKIQQLI